MNKKLYILESGFTSDPSEPSETLNFGVYDCPLKAKEDFLKYIKNIVNSFELKEFEIKSGVAFDFQGVIEKYKQEMTDFIKNNQAKPIGDFWNLFKTKFDNYMYDNYAKIFTGTEDWSCGFCYWYNKFTLPRFDSFEIKEIELNVFISN